MLGSLHDAEDVVQDALLRAWRGLKGFDGRSSLRVWMYRIATNACLDVIARRPKRVLPIDYSAGTASVTDAAVVTEDSWIDPYPDRALGVEDGYAAPDARYEQREAIELAFVAALQHLAPRQRAVLVLREVLGFSAKEVATMLGATPASVNSALQRARKTIDERVPEPSQLATARSLGDPKVREIVERFSDAFERGDTQGILCVLTEDVTFSMPPHAGVWKGRTAVSDSWLMPGGPPPRLRYRATRANGQPALAVYALDEAGKTYRAVALDVLTLRGSSISHVRAFRRPELFPTFGLPTELAA
jgi:RNA polymerase sigma-70 factor (ECF subfamily)